MTNNRRFPDKLKDEDSLFYLESCRSEGDGWTWDVWFINNTDEILAKVKNASGGFLTAGDDILMRNSNNSASEFIYENVMPREAVLIDDYDEMYDSDFLIEFGVDVISPSIGEETFKSAAGKGAIPGGTIRWKPLPPDASGPDNQGGVLSPEEAAISYMENTGNYLDKSIFLNRGDLKMDYAAERLAPSGVVLEKIYHRDGRITEYLFTDADRICIYRTCDYIRACVFVENLRKKQ